MVFSSWLASTAVKRLARCALVSAVTYWNVRVNKSKDAGDLHKTIAGSALAVAGNEAYEGEVTNRVFEEGPGVVAKVVGWLVRAARRIWCAAAEGLPSFTCC